MYAQSMDDTTAVAFRLTLASAASRPRRMPWRVARAPMTYAAIRLIDASKKSSAMKPEPGGRSQMR